jgi:hypothetical protein
MSMRTLLLAGLGTAVLLGTGLPARADWHDGGWHHGEWHHGEWHHGGGWGWHEHEWHHHWHPYYRPWAYAPPPVYAPSYGYYAAPPPVVSFGFRAW